MSKSKIYTATVIERVTLRVNVVADSAEEAEQLINAGEYELCYSVDEETINVIFDGED